jgi:hypothetical protein
LRTFFIQTESTGQQWRLVADNPVSNHPGTRNISLEDQAIDGVQGIRARQINCVIRNREIYVLPSPADDQTLRLGTDYLVMIDHHAAVVQAVDIETVDGVDGVVVVEVHI